jgi:hypothetical protein
LWALSTAKRGQIIEVIGFADLKLEEASNVELSLPDNVGVVKGQELGVVGG